MSHPVLCAHPVSGLKTAATQLTRSTGDQLYVEDFASIISTAQPQRSCLTPVSQPKNQLSSQSHSPRAGVTCDQEMLTMVRRC